MDNPFLAEPCACCQPEAEGPDSRCQWCVAHCSRRAEGGYQHNEAEALRALGARALGGPH